MVADVFVHYSGLEICTSIILSDSVSTLAKELVMNVFGSVGGNDHRVTNFVFDTVLIIFDKPALILFTRPRFCT